MHLQSEQCSSSIDDIQSERGQRAYFAGFSAEGSVERYYLANGFTLAAQRWRGTAGELDLVFRKNGCCIFVEVKKSRSFDHAAGSLPARQVKRILSTASEFVADEPNGQLTEMRFDVALVSETGEIHVLENALSA